MTTTVQLLDFVRHGVTLRDYLRSVNALLSGLGRPTWAERDVEFAHDIQEGWERGDTANDCVVRTAYHGACRRADRNA